MLSNLIITRNKFVLFVDDHGYEKYSKTFISNFLDEKDQLNYTIFIEDLDLNLTKENVNLKKNSNIVLPPLSLLLLYHNSSKIFQFINSLKRNPNVKQIFLWASTKNITEHFVVPFLEYMADLIVNIKDSKLNILTKKSGGQISSKNYSYKATPQKFIVDSVKIFNMPATSQKEKPENIGTFKIDLEEEELVARNALKLPYERKPNEGSITYTPDADDDFDEEDPDEDLCI